jgi:tRNA(Ile)-lysidine synthase
MLNATRSEVRQYVEMHKLEPRHDSSNEDESYTRVFLRRQVLPQLRKLNPSVESSFATAALLLGDEDDFLNELADGILEEISEETGSGVELRIDSLSELHPALQRRVIRRLVLKVTGSLRRITYRHVEAILAAALDEETAVQFSGFSFAQVLDRLVATEQADEPEIAFEYTVRSGQTIELKEVDKSFTLRIIEASSGVDFVKLSGPGRAFADADAVGDVLRVRNWRPGDRYRSLGAPGSQKLHDIFINAKIDRKCRPGTPVFLAGNRIVWVSGFRIADEFRITEKTERILSIEEV